MQAERDRLTTMYLSAMIRLARHQIYRLDERLSNEYADMNEQDKALRELPTVAQMAVEDIKRTMNEYREPESFIRMLRVKFSYRRLASSTSGAMETTARNDGKIGK